MGRWINPKKYNVDKYIPEETDRNTIAGLGAFSGLSSDANEILMVITKEKIK